MSEPKRKSSSVRLMAQAAVVLGVLVIGAVVVFQHLFARDATSSSAPVSVPRASGNEPELVPPGAPVEEAVILSMTGDVQRTHANGEWSKAVVGEYLRADDSLRTGAGARAELQVGASSKLTVSDSTELKVREISRAVHRFRLKQGRIVADYAPDGGRVLRIEGESSDAVAETKGGRFSVLANGSTLAVATEKGAVDLSSAEESVEVAEGEVSVASRSKPPTPPQKLPSGLLLKVAKAHGAEKGLCAVQGTVSPGAEVRVEGTSVPVDAQGRFRVELRPKLGQDTVLISSRDISGRVKEERAPCRVPKPQKTQARIEGVEIDWNGPRVH